MTQRLDINRNGVNGWYCTIHNVYNDILREHCCYCDEYRDASLDAIASSVRIRREGITMSETERELHAEFFTRWSDDERLLIKDMSDDALTAHRNELARIALESKVRTTTADEEIRQRRAKKGLNDRQWLVPTDVDSAITQVKQRQARMTKEEKLYEQMKSLGVEVTEEFLKRLTDNKLNAGGVKSTIKRDNDVRDLLEGMTKLGVEPSEELIRKIPEARNLKLIQKNESKNDEPFDFSKLGD